MVDKIVMLIAQLCHFFITLVSEVQKQLAMNASLFELILKRCCHENPGEGCQSALPLQLNGMKMEG